MEKESTGRTISFWMSHEEIAALGAQAAELKVSRNEAGRRAVRHFTSKPTSPVAGG